MDLGLLIADFSVYFNTRSRMELVSNEFFMDLVDFEEVSFDLLRLY